MRVVSKLEEFKNNKEKLNRYRRAVQTLKEIGVDQVLLELSLPEDVKTLNSPNAGNVAIAALYESLGYQACLNALFSLDDLALDKSNRPVADFGATEKLGLSEKEAREFSEGL